MAVTLNANTSTGFIATSDTSGVLQLQTAGTTALTVDASQNVTMAGKTTNPTTISVGNATPSTSGAGITFPSTDLHYSTNANTLDDYEEGTWTPNQGAGLTVVGTFSSEGSYTKVGRIVTIRGAVFGNTSIAASSAGRISSNLPFAPNFDTAGSYFNGALSAGGQVDAAPTGLFAVGTIATTTGIYFSVTYAV